MEAVLRFSYKAVPMLTHADRDIRLGLWRIHILHHAAAREVWGTWLLGELAEHGHRLSPGTLYPALARMERHGWLERVGGGGHSRSRRRLRITPEGLRLLEAIRRDVSRLYAEVVVGLQPRPAGRASRRTPRPARRRTPKTRRRGAAP